jgi:endonuclease/exonuclease/phosphatase family metal-dependent hydrolase
MLAHAGNGLLSRIEPSRSRSTSCPGPFPAAVRWWFASAKAKQALYLVILHLALGRRARAQQFSYVAGLIREYPHVVVMGDLNTGPVRVNAQFLRPGRAGHSRQSIS